MMCPYCQASGLTIVGVQYRGTVEDYDGISEWRCDACQARWGRWTGRILQGDELEPRHGHPRRSRS